MTACVSQPIGRDRDFGVEPVMRPTLDLHKLAQALLNVAIDKTRSEKPAPASQDMPATGAAQS